MAIRKGEDLVALPQNRGDRHEVGLSVQLHGLQLLLRLLGGGHLGLAAHGGDGG